jgi:hypothetical protein
VGRTGEYLSPGLCCVEGNAMTADLSKPVEFSPHAREKMLDRGASEAEVEIAVRTGNPEPARRGATYVS